MAVGITWLVLISYVVWTHGQLPKQVAVHFGAGGEPDRWSSPRELTLAISMVATLEFLTFTGIAWFLPRISQTHWNLPNKNYWLAPERAVGTTTRIGRDLLAMAFATLLLLGAVHWDVVQANQVRANQELAITIGAVVVYMFLLAGILVTMILHFRRIPSPPLDDSRLRQ
tara:strand:+ start:36054 stop:36563 length:510 start_codon:yes stop_codon:yes gene_type:complete